MAVTGKILVFVDLPDGGLDETGRGLLAYAGRLAGVLGTAWESVTLVTPGDEALAGFGAYGTPVITRISGAETLLDTPALLGKTLARLVAESGATVLVLPHNDLGATLAPVCAVALDAAILTEVVTARQGTEGLHLTRNVLGNRIAETRVWDGSRPLVITVPVRNLSQVLLPSVRPSTPAVATWEPAEAPEGAAARIVDRIPPDPQTVDLTDAEVIFSVGKGCDEATFTQFKELCRLLNASLGVTRPVFDLGWTGFERMVGQTGRTVTPRLYVALGISGSMHHVGGIKDSRRIVAVNIDPKAPIFPNSDEGFVADLRELIPCLIEKVKSATGGVA
jgi:electron transfer flavoprotein alpha subunit